jgi:hypothetical protein
MNLTIVLNDIFCGVAVKVFENKKSMVTKLEVSKILRLQTVQSTIVPRASGRIRTNTSTAKKKKEKTYLSAS